MVVVLITRFTRSFTLEASLAILVLGCSWAYTPSPGEHLYVYAYQGIGLTDTCPSFWTETSARGFQSLVNKEKRCKEKTPPALLVSIF